MINLLKLELDGTRVHLCHLFRDLFTDAKSFVFRATLEVDEQAVPSLAQSGRCCPQSLNTASARRKTQTQLPVVQQLLQRLVVLIHLHTTLDHDPGLQDLAKHLCKQRLPHVGLDIHHPIWCNVDMILDKL
ncbi:hypothetical protein KC364_g82 [Hortaea werneckii]|nr:hypothetical protein KC364_g82 [Hortaea werneckii]